MEPDPGEVGIASGERTRLFRKIAKVFLREGLPTHLVRRPFTTDRETEAPVRGTDDCSLGGFLPTSTFGN